MLAEPPPVTQRAGTHHRLLDRRLEIAPGRIAATWAQRHRTLAARQSSDGDVERDATDRVADRAQIVHEVRRQRREVFGNAERGVEVSVRDARQTRRDFLDHVADPGARSWWRPKREEGAMNDISHTHRDSHGTHVPYMFPLAARVESGGAS